MADRRSGAGWRTAAVVAPAAAAVLAVSTGWALEHQPVVATNEAPPDVAAPGSSQVLPRALALDRADMALHRRAETERGRVVRLTKALRRLRAHAEVVTSAPLGAGPAPAQVSSGPVYVAAAPAPAAAAPQPAIQAPATHASTGAS